MVCVLWLIDASGFGFDFDGLRYAALGAFMFLFGWGVCNLQCVIDTVYACGFMVVVCGLVRVLSGHRLCAIVRIEVSWVWRI